MTPINSRKSEFQVQDFFIHRWSPKSFSNETINENDLWAILEAAHWAPSCFNEQPWRFYVAKSNEMKANFVAFLSESNREWARTAPVLIAIVSKLTFSKNDKPNRWNAFDSGTAWGYMTMEAYQRGYATHAMGGFNKEQAKEVLGLTDDYQVQAIVAVGRYAPQDSIPQEERKLESISTRKPATEVTFLL